MEFLQMPLSFLGLMALVSCESPESINGIGRSYDLATLRQKLAIASSYIAVVEDFVTEMERLMLELPLENDIKNTGITQLWGRSLLQPQRAGIKLQNDASEGEESDLTFVDLDADTLAGLNDMLVDASDSEISITDMVPPTSTDEKSLEPDKQGSSSPSNSEYTANTESCTEEKYQFESDAISEIAELESTLNEQPVPIQDSPNVENVPDTHTPTDPGPLETANPVGFEQKSPESAISSEEVIFSRKPPRRMPFRRV